MVPQRRSSSAVAPVELVGYGPATIHDDLD